MKNGFTLVELSIVLVIIGLLIGGILVGQSLIESAKLNAFIRQIQQFDIAAQNFRSKFKKLPGDSPLFAVAGDGNGYLSDGIGGGPQMSTFFAGEVANFWVHLSQAGFADEGGGTFSATITTKFSITGVVKNTPKMKFGNNAGVVVSSYAASPTSRNFYVIGNFDAVISNLTAVQHVAAYSFTPTQAMAIDSKLDDGLVTTGLVIPVQTSGTANTGAVGTPSACRSASDNTKYDTTNSSLACILRIDILTQTGN